MSKIRIDSAIRDSWGNIVVEYTFIYPDNSTKSGKEVFTSNATEEDIFFLLRKRYHEKSKSLPDVGLLKGKEVDFDKEDEEDSKLI